jgi:hypothetical protein
MSGMPSTSLQKNFPQAPTTRCKCVIVLLVTSFAQRLPESKNVCIKYMQHISHMTSGELVAHVRMFGNAANGTEYVCNLVRFHANGDWYL